MSSKKKTIVLCLALLAATGVTAFASLRAQDGQKPGAARVGRIPVADISAAERADEQGRRKAKAARYNRAGAGPIAELPPGVEELPLISHWWRGLSALPAPQSDAVVLGEITTATAFLSDDKSGVYSEFGVRVEEVFKGDLAPGASVVAARHGGAVRFPSGRVQRYVVSAMHLPGVGERYVLFLKREEGTNDYRILTGYELHGGAVTPLDGPDVIDRNSKLPFSAYEGASEADFLRAVREATRAVAVGRGGASQ